MIGQPTDHLRFVKRSANASTGEAQALAQEAVGKVLEGRRYSHGKVLVRAPARNFVFLSTTCDVPRGSF